MKQTGIKNFQAGLFKSASLSEVSSDSPAYCLSQLEVFNWGPFAGLHRIDLDPSGCALIGQTGSGKTTLVDAIMTLICALPKYNLASTGGHESDRDLMSYVRGVTGTGGDDESQHIARPGQTITGLSANYIAGDSTVCLTGLLWLDSSSTSQSDMKRLWIFDKRPEQGLADYLQQLQSLGLRGLKLQLKEQAELSYSQNKKTYLAQCRRFFEVGENAFTLLNRAAGLKQLNSIDELFRNLVLDDRSAFDRAQQVIEEFDELKGIHSELQIAREQQQSLLPIFDLQKRRMKTQSKLQNLNQQQQLLPRWFAFQTKALWLIRAQDKQLEIDQLVNKIKLNEQQLNEQQSLVDNYYQAYQRLGGTSIEELKRQIDERQNQLTLLKQNLTDYQQLCRVLSLDPIVKLEQLTENQQQAEQRYQENQKILVELEKSKDHQTQLTLNQQDQTQALEAEIHLVKATPECNIPPRFLQFQKQLAIALNCNEAQIPFVGQSVEVKDKRWQGAIERAMGSHRLRLVVAASQFQKALNWINQRDNQLHVRLLNSQDYQQPQKAMEDGFSQMLNYKDDQHHRVIKNFIASIDRHCVHSVEDLSVKSFSMTRQGLMSGKRGLFEKQDQRPLTQGWMTGFDNQNRLAELQQSFQHSHQQWKTFKDELSELKTRFKDIEQQQNLLQSLQNITFVELDTDSVITTLEKLQAQLKQLQDPDSDTGKAEQQWLSAKKQLNEIQQVLNDCKVSHQIALNTLEQANKQIDEASKRYEQDLVHSEIESIQSHYPAVKTDQIEQLINLEREALQGLQNKLNKQQKILADIESLLGKKMVFAKAKDTGALSEVGLELEDIASYLQQLEILNKEALPTKLERFLEYLNQSSDQGVTQLLTRIDNEVSVIEERIEELNTTLQGVDFQPQRYLQLVPQKITHQSLQGLQKAQRDLRSAAMQDDQGESHFKSLIVIVEQLKDAVERKRTRPALALLDPRYRLQFSVAIIERETNIVIETRTGSKGGSGGEKEIIASFILTASLSYALCPKDRKVPLFGTVILDEAFSKSSQAVAARIIFALRQFGLNPLFVTPNKEMRLLREHTASAVLVHRKNKQSLALSLSWQEIDRHIVQRNTISKIGQ